MTTTPEIHRGRALLVAWDLGHESDVGTNLTAPLAERLAGLGVDVTLLTSRRVERDSIRGTQVVAVPAPGDPEGSIINRWQKGRLDNNEWWDLRLRDITVEPDGSTASIPWGTNALSAARHLLRCHAFSLMVAITGPWVSVDVVAKAHRSCGVPFVVVGACEAGLLGMSDPARNLRFDHWLPNVLDQCHGVWASSTQTALLAALVPDLEGRLHTWQAAASADRSEQVARWCVEAIMARGTR